MPAYGRIWVSRKSGCMVSRRDRRRKRQSEESRRERRQMLRDKVKERHVEEVLRNVRWSCRYLDNCKNCGFMYYGYCSKDGLSCVQVDRFKRRRVFGSGHNPFEVF